MQCNVYIKMKSVQIGYTFLQGFVKHFRKHLCCFPGAPTLNLTAISSSDPRRWVSTPLGPLGSSRPSPWAPVAPQGPAWLLLGSSLGSLGSLLGHSWPPLAPSWLAPWAPLGSSWAPVASPGRPLVASLGLSNLWLDFQSNFGLILGAF